MNIYFGSEDKSLINTFIDNTSNVNTSIERLTTGYKVNSVKDDAAISAVINKMDTKISSINVAESNTNIGLSMLLTAENTFSLMQSHVDRIRSLAVQAANEVYSDDQLKAIQLEINERLEEINRLQYTTEYNGMNLFCESINLDGSKTYKVNSVSGKVDEINTPIAYSSVSSSFSTLDENAHMMADISKLLNIQPVIQSNTSNLNSITTITAGSNEYYVSGVQGIDFDYVYDTLTDTVTFTGENVTVVARDGQSNNIIFDVNNGSYSSNTGSTNITVNGDGNTINSNSGSDNLIISVSANNTVVNGNKNNNLSIIDNGTSTKFHGCIGYPESLPDYGSLSINAGEVMDVVIGDKQYSIQNNNSNNSTISWSLNGSGVISLNCDNFEIIAASNQSDNLVINGTNNRIDTGDLDDVVTNNYGENYINTGVGNDIINLQGGILDSSGVESINLTGSGKFIAKNENVIYSVNGKTYTIKANNELVSYNKTDVNITFNGNNLNIVSNNSATKLNLRVNGRGNSITQSSTNENVTITGDSNNITAVGGNNRFTINGDTNTFNGSALKDTVLVDGVGNIINTNSGNDSITVNGNSNNINSGDGADNIIINGGDHNISAGNGNDVIYNNGTNSTIDGGAGEDSIYETQTDTDYTDIEKIILENSNGIFNLKAGESFEFIMGDASYQITAAQDATFNYSYSDMAISIVADGLTISSTNNSNANLYIVGDSNIISSSDSSNSISIQGNDNKLTTGNADNNITIEGDNNNIVCGDGNSYINILSGDENIINGGNGNDTVLSNGDGTIMSGVEKLYQIVQDKTLQVGITSSINSQITIGTGFMLGYKTIDISTSSLARNAIAICDKISSQISEKVLDLGAVQNRLDSALTTLQVQSDNLISSLSTARDADISEESAKLIQYQILQSASQSLLSTTRNLKRDSVLSIIGSI